MDDDHGLDVDIDKLMAEAEEKTAKQKQELDKVGESVMQKFTLDDIQEFSVYHWQGEDWKGKQKSNEALPHAWIEPPKRERKANYAVDQYFKEALRVT